MMDSQSITLGIAATFSSESGKDLSISSQVNPKQGHAFHLAGLQNGEQYPDLFS